MPENYPIGFQIRAVSNLIKRKLYETHPDGQPLLTDLQGRILGFLYHNQDREIYQKDLEAAFCIRSSTASRLLKRLEDQGLIARFMGDKDARLKRITATPKAVALTQEAERRIAATEAALTRGISREEIECFLATVEKLKANLM